MRVALVHDNLIQFGGAERVLEVLMEIFPHAHVYTLLYDHDRVRMHIDPDRVRSSFLQRLPGAKRHHHYFPLLMPLAMEQFSFADYDIVFSNTHSFAKGAVTGSRTMHISYCFTPTRYVWDDCHRYVREFSRLALFLKLAPLGLSYIRLWDYYAAQRVDSYLTSSQFVAQRIQKYYHREAQVIPPPVETERFALPSTGEDYYLVVARLVPYKRIDVAIEACERLGRSLKVVGVGPDEPLLRQRGGAHTEFLGFVPDEELPALYAGARALLFPQEEDFGLTPLEAAAAGKPTIAFASGGALETIVPDVTGLFFEQQSADALVRAIQQFENREWDTEAIRQHAQRFDRAHFKVAIEQAVAAAWRGYKQEYTTRV